MLIFVKWLILQIILCSNCYIFELALQNVTTFNLDCQLPTEPSNVKLPPVTPAELEFFGEGPSQKNQRVR